MHVGKIRFEKEKSRALILKMPDDVEIQILSEWLGNGHLQCALFVDQSASASVVFFLL